MKPRDMFALAVKIAGLIVFLYGLAHLLYAVLGVANIIESHAVKFHATFGICQSIVGLFMMRGMTPFVDLAFPEDEPPPEEADAKETVKSDKDENHTA